MVLEPTGPYSDVVGDPSRIKVFETVFVMWKPGQVNHDIYMKPCPDTPAYIASNIYEGNLGGETTDFRNNITHCHLAKQVGCNADLWGDIWLLLFIAKVYDI